MQKTILVLFGGVSAEHEVSVVTGLQALEQVDRASYAALPVFVTKKGESYAIPDLASRKQFLTSPRKLVSFGKDEQGGFVQFSGLGGKKVYPYAAYLSFHGGLGEGGAAEGLLESVDIPFTASGAEGSIIAMNKKLAKEALKTVDIPTVPDVRFFAEEITADAGACTKQVQKAFGLPVIVKPAHLGSSIGITIARTEVELEKGLRESAFMDSEVIVEPFLTSITEYNCAVRKVNGTIEVSPIERPISHDEFLTFADKYERGAKKGGSGMASLTRELPAKIAPELTKKIQDYARAAFTAARMKGMARIDFMQNNTDGELYLTEINSIPGSMAYYLWEAAGISFEEQISQLIEQAVSDAQIQRDRRPEYHSDIIERFVQG